VKQISNDFSILACVKEFYSMADEFNMKMDSQPLQVVLPARKIRFNAGFFVTVCFLFYAALGYLAISIFPGLDLLKIESILMIIGWSGLMIFNTVILIYTYALSMESQKLSFANGQLSVAKFRPILKNQSFTYDLNNGSDIISDKLIFSFGNLWYAFLFHDHNASYSENAEKFLVPHLKVGDQTYSFFEFADDHMKSQVIEQLKNKLSH